MKKLIYILGVVMIFGFFSCEQEKIDPGMAPNSELAGTWSVIEYGLDMTPLYGPSHLYTYNTSMEEDYIWVDNIYDWGIKVKAMATSTTTFEATNAVDHGGRYEGVTISEAQILGDSIILRVTLYNADGSIDDDYYEAGHRTTGVGTDTH